MRNVKFPLTLLLLLGSGYTGCITDKFVIIDTKNKKLVYVPLTYCITIPAWVGLENGKNLIAESLDDAKDYESDIRQTPGITTPSAVRTSIDKTFKLYMNSIVSGSSISSGKCIGNISCTSVSYSDVWGNCN